MDVVSDFALNQLTDCIKITICFENYMKAILLLNGFIIHKLDKQIFPKLYQEQFERPISLNEIKAISNWELNEKINSDNEGLRFQIKGITKSTIGMKELLSPNYQNICKMHKEILAICQPYFKYRNNLHLYMDESFSLIETDYLGLTKLIDFLNPNLVTIQNNLVDKFNKSDAYKLKTLEY